MGNFTKFNWTQGTYPWTIINVNPYEGTYSAKSGTISNNKTSVLSIMVNVTANDSISFYKKTSCETSSPNTPSYDYLEFFIDNTSMGRWDGETPWSKSAFQIAAGVHTLKWQYKKDSYGVAGSDCVWIDNIKFPTGFVSKAPLSCILTSSDDTICENESVQLITSVNGGLGGNVYNWVANPTGGLISGSNPNVSPTQTTTYNLTITDAVNATFNSNITIFVIPAPLAATISQSGNQLISSSSVNNQWFNENGIIANATSNTYIPTNTGTYYVRVLNSEGCLSIASNSVYVGFTGVEDNESSEINIYPNPFINEFIINNKSVELAQISIYNSVGQIIDSRICKGGENIKINALQYNKGVYYIKLKTNDKTTIKKIVKVD